MPTTERASKTGSHSPVTAGWEFMHVYKSRKKKKTKQLIPHNTTTTTYQQTNLRGENIDEEDGEIFGDTMSNKGPNTI